MEKMTQNLGFRLIAASILLAFATIFVAGYIVYKQSQVAIENSSLEMVREVAVTIVQPDASSHFEDHLRRYLTSKSGGAWLMDSDGSIMASTYPRFGGAVPTDTTFGTTTVFRLQRGKKLDRFSDAKRTQVFRLTPKEIISKYEEGIAEYDYLDARRTVAFKVIPENGWLLGIEKPVGVAYTELQNIKKYIVLVCIISIIAVSAFSWLAIRNIIQPYYRDVEALNKKLEDSVRRLSTFHKVSRSIQRMLPLEEMLEASIRGIAEALGYERILLHLIDTTTNTAKLEMALVGERMVGVDRMPESVRELKCREENGVIERSMVEQKHYLIRDAMHSGLVNQDRVKALGAREMAVVPLIAESKCIGAITVDNPSSGKRISNDDIETLMTFAGHVGLAVERARLHTELHNYASDAAATDSLTGLFNWNHFIGWLERQMGWSRRDKSPLSVIWAQASCLEEINQKFGYAAGNIALRHLGETVASMVGGAEMGARFGGGEFVIGLPACSENRAREIGEELQKRVAALRFEEKGLEDAQIEIKVSYARFRGEETMPDFLERARRQTTSK